MADNHLKHFSRVADIHCFQVLKNGLTVNVRSVELNQRYPKFAPFLHVRVAHDLTFIRVERFQICFSKFLDLKFSACVSISARAEVNSCIFSSELPAITSIPSNLSMQIFEASVKINVTASILTLLSLAGPESSSH